jgi:hypothetical protein
MCNRSSRCNRSGSFDLTVAKQNMQILSVTDRLVKLPSLVSCFSLNTRTSASSAQSGRVTDLKLCGRDTSIVRPVGGEVGI